MEKKFKSLILLLAAVGFAQTNMVIYSGSTSDNVAVNAVQQITFTPTSFTVAGTGKTYGLDSFKKIFFNNGAVAVETRKAPPAFSVHVAPNPSKLTTNVKLNLDRKAKTRISVYDHRGAVVKTLVSKNLEAGRHTIAWDGKNAIGQEVASGLYHVTINTGHRSLNRSVVYLK